MLIRTRLLLLAALPVPVLLGLAAAVVGSDGERAEEAKKSVAAITLAETAHGVAAAMYAERDTASRIAASEDKGLESLLLADSRTESVPLASELATRADAVRTAAEVLQSASTRNGGLAPLVSRRLDESLRLMRVGSRPTDIRDVIARYSPTATLLGYFGDQIAADIHDTAALRALRSLSVAERVQDHLMLEQAYVRHALATHTFPPELARDFVANDFGMERQVHELLDIYADQRIATPLRAALDAADRKGRQGLRTAMKDFAIRQDLLGTLNQALGYGGLIHHYKDFELRGDEKSLVLARTRAAQVRGLLDRLDRDIGLSATEHQDLGLVREAVERLAARLNDVADLMRRGIAPDLIDQRLRSDDAPVLEALTRLSLFRSDVSAAEWDALSAALADSVEQARAQLSRQLSSEAADTADSFQRRLWMSDLAVITTLVLVGVLGLFAYRRLSHGIGVVVGALTHVAETGDIATRQVLDGDDELGQINAAMVTLGSRLERLATAAERMAAGDYATDVDSLGTQDRLSNAMQSVTRRARDVVLQAQAISRGNYETAVEARSDRDSLAFALADMAAALRQYRNEVGRSQWLSEHRLRILEALRNPADKSILARRVLEALQAVTGAVTGVFFERRDESFLVVAEAGEQGDLRSGTGSLVERAAQLTATLVVSPLPANYLRLSSGLGSGDLPCLTLTALRTGSVTVGAIELGWLSRPDDRAIELLDAVAESIGVTLGAAEAHAKTELLLAQTREQADRLEEQHLELRQTNEELESQTHALRQSEEELKSQREELQTTNEELEERGRLLERQRGQLEKTASELGQATRYKSEFLANMSHELRTPLNSLLILSKELAANGEQNLTADQVEAAQVIYEGGRDLLALINDILDLSKVEAGKMEIHCEELSIPALLADLRRQFAPVAEQKGLSLTLTEALPAPPGLATDRQRLEQILRNLLSNALKFTKEGRVSMTVGGLPAGLELRHLAPADVAAVFTVEDSGIGIAPDRLAVIFDAFRQGDGSTSRKFGGTGLGLTIARQMSDLLGGEIVADSEPGKGSRFVLALPLRPPSIAKPVAGQPADEDWARPTAPGAQKPRPEAPQAPVADDREALASGDRSILVIEDDPNFATVLRDVIRRHGFKCLLAANGRVGLELARTLSPSAVILDLGLPDVDGLTVLEALKRAGGTRHIPVHIVSASEPNTDVLRRGAFGFMHKPAEAKQLREVLQRIERLITEPQRVVLVIEDDRGSQIAIRSLLANDRTRVVTVATGAAARAALLTQAVDCVVLDLSLPDTDGLEFLEQLRADSTVGQQPPVVVYTGRQLSPEENRRLTELAQSIVIKGVASPDRLLDEVVLFLHQGEEDLRDDQKQIVARLHGGADAFAGRKLLLVDDDMRNTFALSGALRKHGFEVSLADNGQLALDLLDAQPEVDAVLMDVMMPVMDGLEATRRIRAQPRFKSLPIIALTARAMAEDRRKCLEAGASDYLSKPVDIDQLLAMLRIWLGRPQ